MKKIESVPFHLKSIFVPIDFRAYSSKALDFALGLAEQFGGEINLLHVIDGPKVLEEPSRLLPTLRNEAVSAAYHRDRLQSIVEAKRKKPVRMSFEVHSGRSYDEICEAAKKHKSDLIVIGTHGRTGLKRLFLGSTAERVVRYASCPVLVVRGYKRDDAPKLPPKRILVPTDFSPCSNKAIAYALALAKAFHAKVQLLNVIPSHYPAGEYDYLDYALLDAELDTAGRKQLADMVRTLAKDDARVKAFVRHGRTATEIVETAKDLHSDLIVIATHGQSRTKHTLIGSVTEEVVRHASCPVLAVRELEHEFIPQTGSGRTSRSEA